MAGAGARAGGAEDTVVMGELARTVVIEFSCPFTCGVADAAATVGVTAAADAAADGTVDCVCFDAAGVLIPVGLSFISLELRLPGDAIISCSFV